MMPHRARTLTLMGTLALGGMLAAPAPAEDGSLFPLDNNPSLVANTTAIEIGDIVTILINERATASDTAASSTSRKSSSQPDVAAGAIKIFGDVFGNLGIETDNSSSGSGTTTHQGTLTAQISARVIDELPNGNLLIEGRREITINNDSQFIKLTGIIRRKDVTAGNTIQSTLISDARIAYYGKGPTAEKNKPGVLQKVFDIIF